MTRFVCGYLACDPRVCRPLFSVAPADAPRLDRRRRRVAAPNVAGRRAGVPSAGPRRSLAARQACRAHVRRGDPSLRRVATLGQHGWLAGLRDRHVGRALALLHGDPAHPWTVDGLAREVAMSRSAFAERFVDLIGEPPMQYLTRWRLALAAQRCAPATTRRAHRRARGYESEAAFNRAFKRDSGCRRPRGARACASKKSERRR